MLEEFLNTYKNLQQIELVLVDPNGIARGKWAPASTLKKAFAEGVNFPLSAHGLDVWGNEVDDTGLHISSGDLDGFCVAVPHTLSVMPQMDEVDQFEAKNAQIILKTLTAEGLPFWGCSRNLLERVVDKLAIDGWTADCAFEIEFHLLKPVEDAAVGFQPAEHGESPHAQLMYDLDALADKKSVIDDIRRNAVWAGLPVDTIVKEAGPGQYEVNLDHRADALRAADDVVLLKRVIRAAARNHGLVASFMAKPFIDQPGNGMHVHASLLDAKGANIFSGSAGENRLHHATAGLLGSLKEAALVFINTHNGFRRMATGSYAPTRVNWGANNRSVAVRLPAAPDKAKRVEHRVSGADANPYLVLAFMLEAISAGLKEQKAPPGELVGNAYDETTANRGECLPKSQSEALALFRSSSFAQDLMGSAFHQAYCAIKQAEIDGFANDMSALERRTYV